MKFRSRSFVYLRYLFFYSKKKRFSLCSCYFSILFVRFLFNFSLGVEFSRKKKERVVVVVVVKMDGKEFKGLFVFLFRKENSLVEVKDLGLEFKKLFRSVKLEKFVLDIELVNVIYLNIEVKNFLDIGKVKLDENFEKYFVKDLKV